MESYPDLVRRALTQPSGALRGGVSVSEYGSWMRCAYNGSLAEVYKDFDILHKGTILSLARFNTTDGLAW